MSWEDDEPLGDGNPNDYLGKPNPGNLKKYVSCAAPTGQYCARHGVTHEHTKTPVGIRWARVQMQCMHPNSPPQFLVEDVQRERGDLARELRRIHAKGKDSTAAWVLLAALAENLEGKSK